MNIYCILRTGVHVCTMHVHMILCMYEHVHVHVCTMHVHVHMILCMCVYVHVHVCTVALNKKFP